MGRDRWPALQTFLSEHVPDALLGDTKELPSKVKAKLPEFGLPVQMNIAQECWDFLRFFKDRYDDWSFLRDGFGVLGKPPADHRGKGQTALSRMKLLYDILAETVRASQPDWEPHSQIKWNER